MSEVNIAMMYVMCAEGSSTQVWVLVLITHVVNRYVSDVLVFSVETFVSMVISALSLYVLGPVCARVVLNKVFVGCQHQLINPAL